MSAFSYRKTHFSNRFLHMFQVCGNPRNRVHFKRDRDDRVDTVDGLDGLDGLGRLSRLGSAPIMWPPVCWPPPQITFMTTPKPTHKTYTGSHQDHPSLHTRLTQVHTKTTPKPTRKTYTGSHQDQTQDYTRLTQVHTKTRRKTTPTLH